MAEWDNEMMSSIQRMTRGEAVGKSNRRNSVCEATRANQKSTRGISLEDEMNPVGQPMILRHVARKDPCE